MFIMRDEMQVKLSQLSVNGLIIINHKNCMEMQKNLNEDGLLLVSSLNCVAASATDCPLSLVSILTDWLTKQSVTDDSCIGIKTSYNKPRK